jgi:exonuclease SbcD
MAYRILHIADVHLDMAFAGLDAAHGKRRREQLREAFERALALGQRRGVDAICIAGDLYEGERSGPDRAAYLHRVLGDLAPARVFISPGNHDPYTASSLYRQIAPLPENVTVFDTRRFARVPLTDGITLWGFGHERDIDRDPAIADFVCEGPGVHLLLFHGSDSDSIPPGKEAVAPFSAADIERTRAHYAMVGHFHGMRQGARFGYPGSLEPHNYTQDGRHTACIVTVDNGRVGCEFVDINRVRYADVEFDVEGYGDGAALAAALKSRLGSASDAAGPVYYRVRLIGEAAPTLDLDAEALESGLNELFPGIALVPEFATIDYAAVQHEGYTVRSEFLRKMRETIESAPLDERPLFERALQYGMLAFAKKAIPK